MKKSKKIIFFSLLAIVGLFTAITVYGNSLQNTPEGRAQLTEMAYTKTPTKTVEITSTAKAAIKPSPIIMATSTIEITPTPEISDLQFRDIVDQHRQMTDVQWKAYAKSIQWETVQWTGYVKNVDKSLGSVTVTVCIGSCQNYVFFDYPENEALKLNKQQNITFTGKISIVDDMFGIVTVYLDNTQIISQ